MNNSSEFANIAYPANVTRDLVASCPSWCVVQHDSQAHPEDVFHQRVVTAEGPMGHVCVEVWPIPLVGTLPVNISIPEHGMDINREDAVSLATALLDAVRVMDELAVA